MRIDNYAPGDIKEDKKFFRKSLTVKAGDSIFKPSVDKKKLFKKLLDPRTRRYVL